MKAVGLLAVVLCAFSYCPGVFSRTAQAEGLCYGNWRQNGPGCSGCTNGACGDCIMSSPFNTCGGSGSAWICNKQQTADLGGSGDYAISQEMPCSVELHCTAGGVWPCAGNKCVLGTGTGNYSATTFYQLQPTLPRGECNSM